MQRPNTRFVVDIPPYLRRVVLSALAACGATCGCGVMDQATGVTAMSRRIAEERHQEERYREAFLVDGDAKAIAWLLTHRVQDGMNIDEVNRILGQDGERELSDSGLKKHAGYRVDDVTYRWGPDDRGRVYYLMFRDDRLVNFRPEKYAADSVPEDDSSKSEP